MRLMSGFRAFRRPCRQEPSDPPPPPDARHPDVRYRPILIDALYEARTHLIILADAEPTELYPKGDGSFEFERTASRLQEMRSAGWLEDR